MNEEEDLLPALRLLAACDRGDVETIRTLAQQGYGPECALYRTAKRRGYVEVLKVLLQYNADVDSTNGRFKWTALMVACRVEFLEAIKLLLIAGANVNIRDEFGMSALHIAAQYGSTEAVQILLLHKEDVNIRDTKGRSVLMIASESNYADIVRLVLAQHSAEAQTLTERVNTVNTKDFDGWSALTRASYNGCTESVRLLLLYGANVNDTINGWTALLIASYNNRTITVGVLLRYGANVNEQIAGWTSLMIACYYGYSKLIEILLQYDANVNLMTCNKLTALTIAGRRGHTAIVTQLLNHGAHVNMCHWGGNGISGLMFACHNGHTQIAEELLRQGAYVNMKDTDGNTALMFASAKGYSEIGEILLLKYSAKVNMQNAFKESALMLASFNGSIEMVKLLLNHGADVNIQDFDGLSALVYARIQGHNEVAKLLLKCGASLDYQHNVDYQTGLMVAVQRGDAKTVAQLLEFGANVNIQDKDGLTALTVATKNGNIKIVELLIKFGATINTQNTCGYTTLMVACEKGYLDIVILLMLHKADIDVQDKNGCTALMLACQYGHTEIADCLINHGAEVNLTKNDGWTALTLARMNHHTDTMDLLTKYGATDAVPKKARSYHMYTSTYTATGTEDSGYGPSAEHRNDKAADVNSTVIMVTNSDELHFTWEGYGLHLYIPEGALPSEIKRCTISIKAAVEGNYAFSKNSHLVSAVYWFHCVPKCQFSRPIILEIQHCAKEQNLQTLSFVKAVSTEGKPEIKFNKTLGCCGTNHGVFPSHSSYGFIFLNEFCGYSVVQEGSEDRQYRADIYYLPQSIDQFQIHFTVLWNTEAHHSIIKQHYIQQNAEVGPDKRIEFDSESVCLDIPKKGMTTEDDIWKIIPLVFPPEVTKTEVDSFDVGKRIPACQLQAIAQKPHELTHLIHPLKLLGTKTLRDYITLFRSPASLQETSSKHSKRRIPSNDESDSDDDDDDSYYNFRPNQVGPYPPTSSTVKPKGAPHEDVTAMVPPLPTKRESKSGSSSSHKDSIQPVQSNPLPKDPLITLVQSFQGAALLPSTTIHSEALQSHEALLPQSHQLQESITATSQTVLQAQARPEPPRLTTLLNELTNRVSAKWEEIGISLRLESGLLEIIKEDNPKDCRACLRNVLKEWLKRIDPPPSWVAIIKAVKDAGYRPLARTLREKYLPNK